MSAEIGRLPIFRPAALAAELTLLATSLTGCSLPADSPITQAISAHAAVTSPTPTADLSTEIEISSDIMRDLMRLKGGERIPAPAGFTSFKNAPTPDGKHFSIIGIKDDKKQLGWEKLGSLVDGKVAEIKLKGNTKTVTIDTGGNLYSFSVPASSEVLVTDNQWVSIRDALIFVLFNPLSDYQKGFEQEGNFPKGTVLAISRQDPKNSQQLNTRVEDNFLLDRGRLILSYSK